LAAFCRRACFVVALASIPASVLAQGASTATIAGVVRDSSGAVLPGVTVEAASPALIEKVRSTVSDERGQYRLSDLRPGAYTVTFSLAGFATVKNEGLELRTNFTATVDAELKVSQLEETITVTGATPLVDVTSATQQRTVTREVLDTVPTAKSVLGIAALIPAVVEPPNAQDVGGSKGERSVRITVHGGKTFDSRLLQDGMRYNALTPGIGSLEGTGRGYYVNPLSVQEVVVDLGTMGSAEYSLGGAQVNSIPKEGGNRFTGSIFLAGTGSGLQSDNLDDELRSVGLTSINSVKKVFDYNAAFGGPIVNTTLAQDVPALPVAVLPNWNTLRSNDWQVNPSEAWHDGVRKIAETFTVSVLFGVVARLVMVMVAVLISPTLIGVGNDGITDPPTPASAGNAASIDPRNAPAIASLPATERTPVAPMLSPLANTAVGHFQRLRLELSHVWDPESGEE